MAKKVTVLNSFNQVNGFPSPEFRKEDFQDSIWNKGYSVIHEKTVICPCRSKNSEHLSSCQNCQGSGWVVIDAQQTKMLLTSINSNTKYKAWSEQNIGTVSISADTREKLAYMDKITVLDSLATFTQLLFLKQYNGNIYSFTIYKPVQIEYMFLFDSDSTPLVKLYEGTNYEILDNKIVFKNIVWSDNLRISVRYKHHLVYGIIDLPHDVRNSYIINNNGMQESIDMPVQAIGRRFHYLVDASNYSGDNLIDNSTL